MWVSISGGFVKCIGAQPSLHPVRAERLLQKSYAISVSYDQIIGAGVRIKNHTPRNVSANRKYSLPFQIKVMDGFGDMA